MAQGTDQLHAGGRQDDGARRRPRQEDVEARQYLDRQRDHQRQRQQADRAEHHRHGGPNQTRRYEKDAVRDEDDDGRRLERRHEYTRRHDQEESRYRDNSRQHQDERLQDRRPPGRQEYDDRAHRREPEVMRHGDGRQYRDQRFQREADETSSRMRSLRSYRRSPEYADREFSARRSGRSSPSLRRRRSASRQPSYRGSPRRRSSSRMRSPVRHGNYNRRDSPYPRRELKPEQPAQYIGSSHHERHRQEQGYGSHRHRSPAMADAHQASRRKGSADQNQIRPSSPAANHPTRNPLREPIKTSEESQNRKRRRGEVIGISPPAEQRDHEAPSLIDLRDMRDHSSIQNQMRQPSSAGANYLTENSCRDEEPQAWKRRRDEVGMSPPVELRGNEALVLIDQGEYIGPHSCSLQAEAESSHQTPKRTESSSLIHDIEQGSRRLNSDQRRRSPRLEKNLSLPALTDEREHLHAEVDLHRIRTSPRQSSRGNYTNKCRLQSPWQQVKLTAATAPAQLESAVPMVDVAEEDRGHAADQARSTVLEPEDTIVNPSIQAGGKKPSTSSKRPRPTEPDRHSQGEKDESKLGVKRVRIRASNSPDNGVGAENNKKKPSNSGRITANIKAGNNDLNQNISEASMDVEKPAGGSDKERAQTENSSQKPRKNIKCMQQKQIDHNSKKTRKEGGDTVSNADNVEAHQLRSLPVATPLPEEGIRDVGNLVGKITDDSVGERGGKNVKDYVEEKPARESDKKRVQTENSSKVPKENIKSVQKKQIDNSSKTRKEGEETVKNADNVEAHQLRSLPVATPLPREVIRDGRNLLGKDNDDRVGDRGGRSVRDYVKEARKLMERREMEKREAEKREVEEKKAKWEAEVKEMRLKQKRDLEETERKAQQAGPNYSAYDIEREFYLLTHASKPPASPVDAGTSP